MENPRNVAILVFDDIEILDFPGPYEVFNVAAEAVTPAAFYVYNVGVSLRPVIGRGRFTVTPQYSIESCPQADILVIPGGYGTRPLMKHEEAHCMDPGAVGQGRMAPLRVHGSAPPGKGRHPEGRAGNHPPQRVQRAEGDLPEHNDHRG